MNDSLVFPLDCFNFNWWFPFIDYGYIEDSAMGTTKNYTYRLFASIMCYL
jgi:hypothetical protein